MTFNNSAVSHLEEKVKVPASPEDTVGLGRNQDSPGKVGRSKLLMELEMERGMAGS